eukprot:7677311-Alexandrium_andersonii.AAC.1
MDYDLLRAQGKLGHRDLRVFGAEGSVGVDQHAAGRLHDVLRLPRNGRLHCLEGRLSLIHISEPTRLALI